MAASRFFSNTAVQTALSGNISSGATSISVSAVTGFPSLPYTLALDYGGAAEELVNVTAAASTTLTVTRGYGGTSAQSHSIGAVVRHVYDATEAAAFRTHEGAAAAIHGVTGTLVGTSDTQTLGNKTLTAPAITAPVITGGGSLAGTFTGTPTFSGALTFSGAVALSAGGSLAGTFTGTPTYSGAPSLTAGAAVSGGPVTVTQALVTSPTVNHQVTGDVNARLLQQADGTLVWGSGATAGDARLYRQAAGVLRTDTDLQVGGALAVTGDVTAGSTTWTTYVPAVANQGTATYSRQVAWYKKLGKLVYFEIYLASSAAGSGSTGLTMTLPSMPYRDGGGTNTTRQIVPGQVSAASGSGNAFQSGPIVAIVNASGTTAVIDSIQDAVGTVMWGQNIGSGTALTIQGWYREA